MENRKVVDYKIVQASFADNCETEVRELLEQGYVLHGNLFMSGFNYTQAMVKYESIKPQSLGPR